jgi:hypothetical protein
MATLFRWPTPHSRLTVRSWGGNLNAVYGEATTEVRGGMGKGTMMIVVMMVEVILLEMVMAIVTIGGWSDCGFTGATCEGLPGGVCR